MADKTLATFRLDEQLWLQFKNAASAKGTNASALLTEFVGSYLDGLVPPTPTDTHIDTTDIRLDNLSLRLDNIEDTIDKRIDSRLDELRSSLEELRGKLKAR